MSLPRVTLCLALLAATSASAGGGAKRTRPRVDVSAMREAMAASTNGEGFASSASYAHYLRARLLHHGGDHRAAIDALKLALATDDGNPFLLTALAEQYARLSELAAAERELRKVIERNPAYAPAQLLMGRVLMEGRKLTRAQVHLRRAIQLSPIDVEPYLALAQLHLERGAPQDAVTVVEELAAALPGEASGYRRLGLALAERNDARAEPLLRKALARDPGDFEAWVALAGILRTTGRDAAAEDAYASALERDPDDRETLMAAGRLALKQGSTVRARAYFDRLLSLSGDPQQVVNVTFAYLNAGEAEAAAEALEHARGARAEEPRLAFYAGFVEQRLRRFERAAAAFAEIPEGHELFVEARLHRATALSLLGQHGRALALFKAHFASKPDDVQALDPYARALERSGASDDAARLLVRVHAGRKAPETFTALAAHHSRRGQHADAVKLLDTAVKQYPKDEVLRFLLGAALDRVGDLDGSLRQMRWVLDLNPKNAPALNFIGYTLADRGRDLDEAERLVTRALELKPDTGEYLDSLGWVYFRKGDHARAVEYLEKAAARVPGDPIILEHLGDAYSQRSQLAEAKAQYEKALQALQQPDEELTPAAVAEQRRLLEKKLKALSTHTADR